MKFKEVKGLEKLMIQLASHKTETLRDSNEVVNNYYDAMHSLQMRYHELTGRYYQIVKEERKVGGDEI